jgi:tetratricopeptide (TPR) repeat protein
VIALLCALWAVARAEAPLPSFERALGLEAWAEVDALLERGEARAAIDRAEAFQHTVVETAGLRYLTGLAWRRLDRDDRALAELERSVALDPEYAAPWYDLGEVHLVAGRWEEAARAFTEVARLVPDGPTAALAPLRLAEVAAHQGDAEGMETHLREALRRGLSLRELPRLAQWRAFYADPALRDGIEKMVTVYGDLSILVELRAP